MIIKREPVVMRTVPLCARELPPRYRCEYTTYVNGHPVFLKTVGHSRTSAMIEMLDKLNDRGVMATPAQIEDIALNVRPEVA